MDVRCSSVFYCLFFGGGVSMDHGGVVSCLRIICDKYEYLLLGNVVTYGSC